MSSRLFLSVREELGLAYDVSSGLVDYADAGALEVSAGVDPDSLPAALEAILAELARLRDELVPEDELTKAKRYLSGGLELRMDDTRHVASWIGGQEALHDRVLTLEEALAAVEAVDAAAVQELADRLFRDDALRLAAVAPARYLRGLEPTPPVAGMTAPAATPRRAIDAGADGRTRPRPRAPAARVAVAGAGRARDDGRSRAARHRRASSTSPRCAGGPATCSAPARRPARRCATRTAR